MLIEADAPEKWNLQPARKARDVTSILASGPRRSRGSLAMRFGAQRFFPSASRHDPFPCSGIFIMSATAPCSAQSQHAAKPTLRNSAWMRHLARSNSRPCQSRTLHFIEHHMDFVTLFSKVFLLGNNRQTLAFNAFKDPCLPLTNRRT